jgi:hypothetical protein
VRLRVLLGRLLGRRAQPPKRASIEILGGTLERAERRVVAELVALPAAELWARFGRDADNWMVLEPVLSARLLVVAQQRARDGVVGAEPLAWLVVALLERQPAGRLAESLQRDLLAEAFLLLSELALAAGDAATGRQRLRLAKVFASTGSGSPHLIGDLELVLALFHAAAGQLEEALGELARVAEHFGRHGEPQREAEAHLLHALAASEAGHPEGSRQAWAEASRLLGPELEKASAAALARWERAGGR